MPWLSLSIAVTVSVAFGFVLPVLDCEGVGPEGMGVKSPEFESSDARTGLAMVENNKGSRRRRRTLEGLDNQVEKRRD